MAGCDWAWPATETAARAQPLPRPNPQPGAAQRAPPATRGRRGRSAPPQPRGLRSDKGRTRHPSQGTASPLPGCKAGAGAHQWPALRVRHDAAQLLVGVGVAAPARPPRQVLDVRRLLGRRRRSNGVHAQLRPSVSERAGAVTLRGRSSLPIHWLTETGATAKARTASGRSCDAGRPREAARLLERELRRAAQGGPATAPAAPAALILPLPRRGQGHRQCHRQSSPTRRAGAAQLAFWGGNAELLLLGIK